VTKKRAAILGVTAVVIIWMLLLHLIHLDHYFGVYGVSIGTNNWYMSIDDKLPIITWEHAS
jgi:hypothetical protein